MAETICYGCPKYNYDDLDVISHGMLIFDSYVYYAFWGNDLRPYTLKRALRWNIAAFLSPSSLLTSKHLNKNKQVSSAVPEGKGVSSSASVEVASMYAIAAAHGNQLCFS